ncbi:amino acid ABC transporter permease (plasmid) [Nicoliella spurrieriana]|uniref:Amino acid ABC transporter permease n=1 Tax=Nicoliella spurrieriana TaxID=2925830 RepID=A0A976RQM1_9LACO|nr:amino acid ABC transporter permease [Nicoliella spurrieriana]UQS86021.1 amino acid ABC transporter permease [Nicoliella spurrieriana]
MDFKFMLDSFPKLVSVLPITLYIAILGTVIGLGLAILISIVRERKTPILSPLLSLYVSVFRGVPIIVQIYIVYYGLPRILYDFAKTGANGRGLVLPSLLIGIVAFSLNASANLSESIRSAYHSIDRSQYDAAIAIGLTRFEAIKRIVFPQMVPNFIPNFSNVFLDLIKDTALVYNIGIIEVMGKANILASFGFNYLEAYLDALVIYLVVCFIFAKLLLFAETKIRKVVFS